MNRLLPWVGLCVFAAGCAGQPTRDAAPVYEAVLRHELRGQHNGRVVYLSVEGQDPSPELLGRLRQQWPALEPASKLAGGKERRVHVGELTWVDGDTAEVRGGFGDGVDGRVSRYRVARKNGQWVVEKAETEAVS